jgi:hypothetical protein
MTTASPYTCRILLILTQIFFNLYWDVNCPTTHSVPYCSILQHTPAVLRCPHHKAGHVEALSYAGCNVITLTGLSCGSRKHHWHYHSCTFTGHSHTVDCYPVNTPGISLSLFQLPHCCCSSSKSIVSSCIYHSELLFLLR